MAWKLSKSNSNPDIPLDMTPCSDIIFTLLLFFILTQQAVSLMRVELPDVGAPYSQDLGTLIHIEVTASGTVFWEGSEIASPGTGIKKAIFERAQRMPASAAVVLEIDRKSAAGTALELFDCLQNAGVQRVVVVGNENEEKSTGE